jgi:DNA-binding MarR family transcriptional regulator
MTTTDDPAGADRSAGGQRRLGPGPDSELTWLLHRAAQRMRTVTGGEAEQHGLSLRDHIVLSALHKRPGLTQIELGRALGIDKTTLTSELDRLERSGLVERTVDPRDRRARTIAVTGKGETLRSGAATAAERAEQQALSRFDRDEIALLRRMLLDLIGTADDPGTCV